ncbi:HDIG domain-containing metalloprotein [Clostridium weizhouense]|uniref:HDIG domain-containing protein n=1 Tax=Clostridium weizhouense TaxID=2859781 RepID=A0ABS7AQX8_9CLOT|nr:HDIG domain-containing metalloprotein [Clostridium weizhouense]MBW6411027.1 HDIG domain-containing protein [Clostridium weizhouense]
MIYRIKQFFLGIISFFYKDDVILLDKYLTKSEKKLFMQMRKSDRAHSFRVCKEAIKSINNYKNIELIEEKKMAKCALLHDIGKVKYSLNTIEKALVIIINKLTVGRFLKYNKYKRINNYYNHPVLGKEMLEKIGVYDSDILYCIENHHNAINIEEDNLYLKLLIRCDDHN